MTRKQRIIKDLMPQSGIALQIFLFELCFKNFCEDLFHLCYPRSIIR